MTVIVTDESTSSPTHIITPHEHAEQACMARRSET
jgi:hypothetical protein